MEDVAGTGDARLDSRGMSASLQGNGLDSILTSTVSMRGGSAQASRWRMPWWGIHQRNWTVAVRLGSHQVSCTRESGSCGMPVTVHPRPSLCQPSPIGRVLSGRRSSNWSRISSPDPCDGLQAPRWRREHLSLHTVCVYPVVVGSAPVIMAVLCFSIDVLGAWLLFKV